jgi:hypothetical protein
MFEQLTQCLTLSQLLKHFLQVLQNFDSVNLALDYNVYTSQKATRIFASYLVPSASRICKFVTGWESSTLGAWVELVFDDGVRELTSFGVGLKEDLKC